MTAFRPSFNKYLDDLHQGYLTLFGTAAMAHWEAFATLGQTVLAAIATTDAPYHTIEHTQQVLWVGQAMLQGKHLKSKNVTPADWLNMMGALLCHDIGYLRGICTGDNPATQRYSTGQTGKTIKHVRGKTDACMAPYHVSRSQQYVVETLGQHPLIDLPKVLTNIELTRFPVPQGGLYQDTIDYPGLCRAADLIGQLSDAQYLQKLPALYCEFEETGMNRVLGFTSAAELRANYPHFYWCVVLPYIRDSLCYLAATQRGRQMIAQLYTNVYLVEQEQQRSDFTSETLKQHFMETHWQDHGAVLSVPQSVP